MKFFIGLVVGLTIIAGIKADSPAQEECRKLHHVDADPGRTRYSNSGCRLDCDIHGQMFFHNLNEGLRCNRDHPFFVCRNGECINGEHREGIGHIDIEVISASLYERANAYASVCIKNNSAPVPLPLKDRHDCVSCSTHVIPDTNYPVWNEVCSNSGKYLFHEGARVTVEVWNHFGEKKNVFLGGITLTIDQLLDHGDNHREVNFAISGGANPGQLRVRITWTPR